MSDALTSKLKELREMCKNAPSGPWREGTGGYYANAYGNFEHTDGMRAFVIASRDLVPRLIAALELAVEQRSTAVQQYRLSKGFEWGQVDSFNEGFNAEIARTLDEKDGTK